MNGPNTPIRVVIVDDHALVVEGLRELLERDGFCSVVGTAGTSAEGVEVAQGATPEVLLVDLRLPDGHGLDLIREVRRRLPTTKVVVVTMTEEPITVAAAIETGIHAYVVKTSKHDHLLRAISVALSGSLYLDDAARAAYENWSLSPVKVTEQDIRILDHLAAGLSHPEIAAQLNMSLPTLNRHIRAISTKLGATSTINAVAEARRRGLI